MKQTVAFLLLFLLTLTGYQSQAQRETDHWFFGKNVGLKFDGPNYTLLPNSKIYTPEGCSTISDSLGNLLFYTDGIKVWNKQHQQMPNGFGLKGDPSSSQSALIIKKPGNNSIYYIFTVAARAESPGLQFSEVDISLNGGLGNVISKNNLLLTPVAEKITAVNHRQDRDIWVIAHKWGDNSFYSFPITPRGIGSPVISQTGQVHSGDIDNSLGCLKASPDGTKIALAIQHSRMFEIFDFNDITGDITNPVSLTDSRFFWAYGVEFSPDGTTLYAGSMGTNGTIHRLSLTDPHPDSIRKSISYLGGVVNALYGSMQLASNGRIYIATDDTNTISVIQAPNNKIGDNRFFKVGMVLGSSKSTFGLPGFNQSYFLVPSFKYKDVCFGDTVYFELRVPYKFQSISYNFDDPASGAENTTTLFNPKHYFTRPGNFDVVATGPINNGSIRTSITRVVVHPLPPVTLGSDTIMCPGDTISITSKGTYKKYKWNTGDTDPVLKVTKPGTYWLEVTSEFGCVDRDSLVVSVRPQPTAIINKKEEICFGDAATFSVSGIQAEVTWPDNSKGPEFTTSLTGRQIVLVKINNCTFTDTIEVAYKNCPEKHFFPNVITPDNDGLNDYFRVLGMPPGAAELTIFNRFGNRVFHTTGYQQNWNGKDVSAGLYFYYLRLPESNQIVKGWLEVIK